MTDVEHNLLRKLVELEQTVAALPAADPKPDLRPLFAQIDELSGQLPPPTDPVLLHYLQKRSYQKARRFLEGRDAENQVGNCRHV